VKFAPFGATLATKGDSIAFNTPKIGGTIMRRNKPDGSGKHPWKAEVTEGDSDVADSVITGRYRNRFIRRCKE
jgi:hypothetical protein